MRNVIVTGGSRGLGLAICKRLSASGFRAIAIARTESPALAEAIAASQGAITFHPCDLTELAAIPDFVKSLKRDAGPLYGLVNNAGLGTAGVLANMPDAAIARLVTLNITAPAALTKYVVRSMMTGGAGRIVNISSVTAFTGYDGLSVYSATKAAMLGFTRSLARELGPLGITVNAVAPGFIDTEMTNDLTPSDRAKIARRSALRRMAEPGDVAAAVDFLFGDAARNITGTTMTVDAGNTA
jgi:3-oxoacyl-[acyl-carrier protein] reductase